MCCCPLIDIGVNLKEKEKFWPEIFFPCTCSCLLKLIRSYVLMRKRCITPSYDSLIAQKLESHVTHVFVYGLLEKAFKKISLQSEVY